VVLVLFSGFVGLMSFETNTAEVSTSTLYVSNNFPNHFRSIQSAIDNASAGDTIRVYAGFYNENITINKSINLIGNSSINTIISHNNTIIKLGTDTEFANWCNISGFTLKDSESYGILFWLSDHTSISDITCINNYRGIRLQGAEFFSIKNCNIEENEEGLLMALSFMGTISGCIFENNSGYAINNLGGFSSNAENIFYNNTFLFNNGSNSTYNSSKIQVLDGSEMYGINYWNNSDGYGNYWSDWTSPDIDSDGIVDNPYEISVTGFKDHYPLVNPPTLKSYSPKILVKNNPMAFVNQEYSITYSALDPGTPQEQLVWSFKSNASWLSFSSVQELSGKPKYYEIGEYWVNISVNDGNNYDFTNFSIKVQYLSKSNVIIQRTGEKFTKIQDAINSAISGDTIRVGNGTYYENVIIKKSINLIGKDRNTTIIDANFDGSAIWIFANGTTISEFTIINSKEKWSGPYPCDSGIGIEIHGVSNCRISQNILINHPTGINNTYNWLTQYYGIRYSKNNTISDNIIMNCNSGIGIGGSTNIIVKNNEILNCSNGIWIGQSELILVYNNNISSSRDYGINVFKSINNTITMNNISNNDCGIIIEYNSKDNLIYYNNFINNIVSAEDSTGNNYWNSSYPAGGIKKVAPTRINQEVMVLETHLIQISLEVVEPKTIFH
jgi:parallel beta-helix repeat protein